VNLNDINVVNNITNVISDLNGNANLNGGGSDTDGDGDIDGDDNGGNGDGTHLASGPGHIPGGQLARTGGEPNRMLTLAFLALVLGGLFVLGSRGLKGELSPTPKPRRRGKEVL
jgi:LPXTG-motif cell wall-anchored protein